jgi:hypothetical protein
MAAQKLTTFERAVLAGLAERAGLAAALLTSSSMLSMKMLVP